MLDDQSGLLHYCSNHTWLTDEEIADAEEKEAKYQGKLKRGKQKLDIFILINRVDELNRYTTEPLSLFGLCALFVQIML